ncbi:hypothetical protein NQ315_016780 [Exocentrus adspersus]|uniref:Luciferin 4-monooxygenase n=1 Tax=Exocentrus adspersus TaxID=1586481 RepID=A0AAV8VE21_9CUCU|nr:hypothetical protein NQ315_016780 [Exocentrus adspersus]
MTLVSDLLNCSIKTKEENENNVGVGQYVADTDETDTYGQVLTRSIRTALKLKERGLSSNDIISTCTYNHKNTIIPLIASLFLGNKSAHFDPDLSHLDTIHLLKLIKPKIIFIVPESVPFMEMCLKESKVDTELVVFGNSGKYQNFSQYLEPSTQETEFQPVTINDIKETIIILFSSGTTGLPKGICLNHYGLLKQCSSFRDIWNKDNTYKDISLLYTTFYWISAVGMLLRTITLGSVRVVCKEFHPRYTWTLIEKYKECGDALESLARQKEVGLVWIPGHMGMPGNENWHVLCQGNLLKDRNQSLGPREALSAYLCCFLFIQITCIFLAPHYASDFLAARQKDVDTSSLKQFLTGGEPVPVKLMEGLKKALPRTQILQGYGQTEACGMVTMFNADNAMEMEMQNRKPKSCGKIMSGYTWKVVDLLTEEILGPNERGELRYKADFTMNGYYNMDSSSAYDADGYLKSGDIVYYDEERCFYIVDRLKEIFKYRGWHILPVILEGVLLTHPSVKDAAVVGIPDVLDGEHPMGIVVLNKGYEMTTPEDIISYVDQIVPDTQRLRAGVKIVKEMLRTVTGKLNRRAMKKMVLEGKI